MHKITEQYQSDIKKNEDFRLKIEVLIKELIIQRGVNFHTIESRIKDVSKLEEKIARKNEKYNDIADITDVVGVRVITYFEDDVDKVAAIIDEEFIKDKVNSIDKRNLDSDRFGYKSLHYVMSLNNERKKLTEYSRFKNMKFEIQIRSVLQHAWAEIEHDIGYKGEHSIPNTVKRNFYRVAALLEMADIEFVKIKNELRRYEENVSNEIKTKPDEVEINSASLSSFIRTSKIVHELNEATASLTDSKIDSEYKDEPEQSVNRLYFLNIKTIKQLDSVLREKKKLIIEFAKKWLAESDFKFSTFSQGISIFYLCYVLVGEKNDIELAINYLKQYVHNNRTVAKDVLDRAKSIVPIYKEISK